MKARDNLSNFEFNSDINHYYLHYLGGCYGNGNRFETKDFCENACPYGSRRIMGPGRPKRPGPQGSLVNICNLPRDLGEYLQFYGNTGCRGFKWGVQNWKDFLPKNQHIQGK